MGAEEGQMKGRHAKEGFMRGLLTLKECSSTAYAAPT